MECPKCKKDTCVLVTAQQKKKVVERRGLLLRILFFPWYFCVWLWQLLFGRRQKYFKTQEWACSYCGHTFPQTFEE